MRKFFVFLLSFCVFIQPTTSYAGLARLAPPPGWSQGMGAAVPGVSGVYNFGAAANAGSFRGQTVLTNAALNVAGQLITVPVGLRVAANAASVAATYSFGNPLLFAAALALPYAYNYWRSNDLEVEDGVWIKKATSPGTSTQYSLDGATWHGSKASACATLSGSYPKDTNWSYTFPVSGNQCAVTAKYIGPPPAQAGGIIGYHPLMSRVVDTVAVDKRPANVTDFEQAIAKSPLPDSVIKELPIDWPVEMPQINPDPAVNPSPNPAPAPASRPLWVPTGDPVKNPNPSPATQPDTWTQPGVRVTPEPTPADPWQVSITPEPITKDDPTPNETVTEEVEEPADPSSPATESDPLCELFPDILACAKLGNAPEAKEVPNADKPLTLTKDSGWGPENGSCPQPRSVNLTFGTVYFPWDLYCQFAEGIKPLVVGLAYLGAALSFFGLGRKS